MEGVTPRGLLTLTSPDFDWDPAMQNSWRLTGDEGYIAMKYCVVSFEIFHYSYTVSKYSEVTVIQDFYTEQGYIEAKVKQLRQDHLTWCVFVHVCQD